MTSLFAHERPLPKIDNCVIMANTYYDPAALRATVEWATAKLATNKLTVWEQKYLNSEIARIQLALSTGRAA